MSNRRQHERASVWLVRRVDGSGWHLFSGPLEAMVVHINRLHRRTGQQHAGREIGD